MSRRCLHRMSANAAEDVIEQANRHVDVRFLEHHGGLDLDDVPKRPVGAQQHAAVAHGIDYAAGLLPSRLEGRTVTNQLDAQEEAATSHIADELMAALQVSQAREESLAKDSRSLLQALVLDDV